MLAVFGEGMAGPVSYGDISTAVHAKLLAGWRKASGDPDDQPETWLLEGAPAGIKAQPVDRGIFPLVGEGEEDPMDVEELYTNFDTFIQLRNAKIIDFDQFLKRHYNCNVSLCISQRELKSGDNY